MIDGLNDYPHVGTVAASSFLLLVEDMNGNCAQNSGLIIIIDGITYAIWDQWRLGDGSYLSLYWIHWQWWLLNYITNENWPISL